MSWILKWLGGQPPGGLGLPGQARPCWRLGGFELGRWLPRRSCPADWPELPFPSHAAAVQHTLTATKLGAGAQRQLHIGKSIRFVHRRGKLTPCCPADTSRGFPCGFPVSQTALLILGVNRHLTLRAQLTKTRSWVKSKMSTRGVRRAQRAPTNREASGIFRALGTAQSRTITST